MADKRNREGYNDPTAYMAERHEEAEAARLRAIDKRADQLIGTIKMLADIAGFAIDGRIALRHRATGREYK